MNAPPKPEVTSSKPFPFVWIVPVIALLVGGYLVTKEFAERGPRITIVFEEGSGIEAGETVLQHKGMAVGKVQSASLTPDLQNVVVVVELQKSAKGLAREGSRFWISRPEIGFQGVSGLDTIFSGPTIQVSPGSGSVERRFVGLSRPPFEGSETGSDYILRAPALGSIKVGTPVLYRDFRVGEVVDTQLASDATAVSIKININSPYHKIVRPDSKFWDASGITMKVGLLGAKINTQSLESVLSGGIVFATPEKAAGSEPAPENTVFQLHTEPDKDWLDWRPVIPLESADAPPAPETSSPDVTDTDS